LQRSVVGHHDKEGNGMGGSLGGTIAMYMGFAAFLIFIYLVLAHGKDSANLLSGLSGANIGAIKALQGR
jgi:hypothetical protein